jgi:hypothetical protein
LLKNLLCCRRLAAKAAAYLYAVFVKKLSLSLELMPLAGPESSAGATGFCFLFLKPGTNPKL